MKAEDLVPGAWYYHADNYDGCKYFMLLKHNRDTCGHNYNRYLIRGINGKEYWNEYSTITGFREITPEEKMRLL